MTLPRSLLQVDSPHSVALKGCDMKRKVPIAVLVSVAVLGTVMTIFVDWAGERAAQSQFDMIANEAAERLENTVEQNLGVLDATAAYMVTNPSPLDRAGFVEFVNALTARSHPEGALGVGFALLADKDRDPQVQGKIAGNYGIDRQIWPETSQPVRSPIILLEPHTKANELALGYDMYSEAIRREAMDRAIATGNVAASGPVELVQESGSEKQVGFLAYLPVKLPAFQTDYATNQTYQGFVYAPFRLGDLHRRALENMNMPAEFQTTDMGAGNAILAQSEAYKNVAAGSGLKAGRDILIGGRRWRLSLAATQDFEGNNWRLATMLLGVVSLLLAAALATSTRAQFVSVENAHKLADLSRQAQRDAERAAGDKDLMLQEMKHRIKNSIARVLAIARQTASSSATLDDFSKSFFARLQSMAAAQELLTRSHWDKADIADLLTGELTQVLGEDFARGRLSGQSFMLNERATQALGLTFHELATNALKYGDAEGVKNGLTVRWQVDEASDPRHLRIIWTEPVSENFAVPAGISEKPGGFGSRLISMTVERELGGTILRESNASATVITMSLPVTALI